MFGPFFNLINQRSDRQAVKIMPVQHGGGGGAQSARRRDLEITGSSLILKTVKTAEGP